MKTSSNISATGVVDGVFLRVVAEELLVSSRAPVGVAGVLIGQDNDARSTRPRQLCRDLARNGKDDRAAQLDGKFNGAHGRNVWRYGRRGNSFVLMAGEKATDGRDAPKPE